MNMILQLLATIVIPVANKGITGKRCNDFGQVVKGSKLGWSSLPCMQQEGKLL
jgi:hypothetical protein